MNKDRVLTGLCLIISICCFMIVTLGLVPNSTPVDTTQSYANGTSVVRADYVVIDEGILINGTRFYPMNSGSVLECYNGSWIAHGLPGDPASTGSISLSIRGPSQYNATRIYRVPTVLASNATHFQIEFLAWETNTWTLVPVGPTWNNTVWWTATYKP